jgi:hypothetical protein
VIQATPIGRLRAAASGSALVRALTRGSAAIVSTGRPPADLKTWEPESERLRTLAGATRIGRVLSYGTDAVARTWAASSSRKALDRIVSGIAAVSAVDRVRAIGAWATAAALTDGLLTPLDPRPVTPSRWVLWAGVLVLGATAAVFAEAVVAAWRDVRARRAR